MAETETGWLLEKMHNGNVHYICADYVLQWTDDPNKALRLSRREDAEALTTIVEDCEKIASHEWPGDSPSDAEQLSELRRVGQWALDAQVEYNGPCDHEARYADDCLQCQLRAALNPDVPKETQ